MKESGPAHWADRAAAEIMAAQGDGRKPVLSTGISPSGEIHIGNMREVLTADAVYRALKERGAGPEFHFVADNFDPLRKVSPFLDAETYAPLVGMPLSRIPCPCGGHDSYGDHFLEPFLESLRELHVHVELVRADELYRSGRMNRMIVTALENRGVIVGILKELTGKQMDETWSPFVPVCSGCRKMSGTQVTGFSAKEETVSFTCDCGASGDVPMSGGGKLQWRIDWPARWSALHVSVEPFGKDHSTRGGSYDTGVRIAREVFGIEPPYPIPYEWISLKGRGDMSSSKGNVLSIGSILKVAPPEVLRYMVMRARPGKTIKFDPGRPLAQLVDQVDDAQAKGRDERSMELSRAAGFEPVGVPYRHLVMVAQVARFDLDKVMEILGRTGYPNATRSAVEGRLGYARNWLDRFAPEDERYQVQETVPRKAEGLSDVQRRFLSALASSLDASMDGAAIHRTVYTLRERFDEVPPSELFQSIYLVLLGKTKGPRAGSFIATLGPGFCADRFREAAEGGKQ